MEYTALVDNIIFFSIAVLMYADLFITYIVLRMQRDRGKRNWEAQEFSFIHRPIMRKFGLEGWVWFAIAFDLVFYLLVYYVLSTDYDVFIRMYYAWFGIYVITLFGNYGVYKLIKRDIKNQNV